MKKNKWIGKVIVIFLVVLAFVAINKETHAAINMTYYSAAVDSMEATDANIDAKLKGVLVDILGNLIYGIASLMELLLGKVFQLLTGTNMFPWADTILFNAVPFLDINIFNPSGASFVGLLKDFLSKTYYTVFSLALTFFGIAVMITAIKLAISAIAEDKAKYKKAIVDWLLGLVMVVGIHYFISFSLYLNEQLVQMASEMALTAIEESDVKLSQLYDESLIMDGELENFMRVMYDDSWNWQKILMVVAIIVAIIVAIVAIVYAWPAIAAIGTAGGVLATVKAVGTALVIVVKGAIAITASTMVAVAATNAVSVEATANFRTSAIERAPFIAESTELSNLLKREDVGEYATLLLLNENYVEYLQYQTGTDLAGDDGLWTSGNKEPEAVSYLALDAAMILNVDGDETFIMYNEDNPSEIKYAHNYDETSGRLMNYIEWLQNILAMSDRVHSNRSSIDLETYAADYGVEGMKFAFRELKSDYKTECYDIEANAKVGCDDSDVMIIYDAVEVLHAKAVLEVFDDYYGLNNMSDATLITNLAKTFKAMAWTTTAGGWKPSQVVIESALLYAILVVQSLIFFISYTKRLFYVIILILLAPVIVVYDFFMKFGK